MTSRIRIILVTAVMAIAALIVMQFVWTENLYKTEQRRVGLHASLLLNDEVAYEVGNSAMAMAQRVLDGDTMATDGGWGGNFDEKTVTVAIFKPKFKKIIRHCKTAEEWYRFVRDVCGQYMIAGMNFDRLDSAYSEALKRNDINIPHQLKKIDAKGRTLECSPAAKGLKFTLSTDTIPLGIDDKDFLVAVFDNSAHGMFTQMKSMLLASLAIVVMLAFVLIFMLDTIFYQQKLSKMRERLVNSLVHDINRPITVVSQIIGRCRGTTLAVEDADNAKWHLDWLAQLKTKLLVTAAVKKNLRLNFEPAKPADIVEEIVGQYKANNKGLDISFESDESGTTADIDRLHFGNAVVNLIDNAVKYSDNPVIRVRCYAENGFFCTSVKDNGIGIPKKYLTRIFRNGFRVPTDKSAGKEGFGIGLSYVRMVVERHQGDIAVNSVFKQGSEFIIRIPIFKDLAIK